MPRPKARSADLPMSTFINYAINHARLTLATLAFLLTAGLVAYVTIPKEAEPDVKVPIIYVQLTQRGISPEDSERLLLRPVETQLKSVSNVKEMRSTGYEGGGYVLLEFEAGFNSDAALADVRAKVDQAKHDLPKDADEPSVQEVNLSLYPVLVVTMAGDLPERTLLRIARETKNQIEQQPGVLSATLRGARDEAVEITAEPMLMKSYGISLDQLIAVAQGSNSLIAAGALEGSSGRFAVKVPGLIEQPQDMLKIPVSSTAGATVTLGDIATVRPTYKDATSITRVNGKQAMTIEVSKRTGANLIETVDGVKKLIATMEKTWPTGLKVGFTQDKSKLIRQMLSDQLGFILGEPDLEPGRPGLFHRGDQLLHAVDGFNQVGAGALGDLDGHRLLAVDARDRGRVLVGRPYGGDIAQRHGCTGGGTDRNLQHVLWLFDQARHFHREASAGAFQRAGRDQAVRALRHRDQLIAVAQGSN